MKLAFACGALLAALSLQAAELRVTTSFRTGPLTRDSQSLAPNIVVRDVAGDGRNEVVSCGGGSAFALSYDGTTYRDTWYSPFVHCTSVAVADAGNGVNRVFVASASGYSFSPTGPSYLYAFDASRYGREIAKVQISSTDAVKQIAAGNVDNDPALEVVAITAKTLYVYDAATLALKWTAPYGGHHVAIGDLEGDGANEIVIADTNDGYVLNGATQAFKWGYLGGFGASTIAGDVDNDGKAEVVGGSQTYSGTSQGVKIINGDTKTTTTLALAAEGVASGDANNDGQNELVVGPDQWGSIEGYTVAGTKLWSIYNPAWGVTSMAVGDPRGDGKNRILWTGDDPALFVGNANTQQIEYTAPVLRGPFRAAVGDLDGDGKPEIVIATATTQSSGANGSAVWVLDYATHRFIGSLTLPAYYSVAQVAIGQVDGDAAKEIVILGSDYSGATLQVFDGVTLQKEWSSPPPPCCSSVGPTTAALVVANIDGDSTDEIIYALSDYRIQVLNGASNFIQYTTAPLPNPIVDMKLADVDGDGVQDLVAGTNDGVYVFKTSDWSQRFIALAPFNNRRVAAMPGHIGAALSDGVATFSGATAAQEWSCTTDVAVALGFITVAGQSRLIAGMNDATLRFYPVGGNTCPSYDTISQPFDAATDAYNAVQMTIGAADVDGDGRPELLIGTNKSASISTVGLPTEARGDVDADGVVTDQDIDALAAYLYGNRAAVPAPADVNGDGAVRPDDLFYLINYRRGTGSAPPQ